MKHGHIHLDSLAWRGLYIVFTLIFYFFSFDAFAAGGRWISNQRHAEFSDFGQCSADLRRQFAERYPEYVSCATWSFWEDAEKGYRAYELGGCASGSVGYYLKCNDGFKREGFECKPVEKQCPAKDTPFRNYPIDTPRGYKCEAGCVVEISNAIVVVPGNPDLGIPETRERTGYYTGDKCDRPSDSHDPKPPKPDDGGSGGGSGSS